MPKIHKKITIIKNISHRYLSFPTAILNNKREIVIAYRDAFFSGPITSKDCGEHGGNGDSCLMKMRADNSKKYPSKKIYDHKITGSNEQHAILSGGSNTLYLFSRQYGEAHRVFFAVSDNGGENFTERKEVRLKEFEFLACYGHLREQNGKLIAPVYGVAADSSPENKRCGAAWIYSGNNGINWKFGGWIARPVQGGPSFNETAIIPVSGKKWLAIIRSGEGRERLYYSYSKNGGMSWDLPEPVGFRGEAPELFELGKGVFGLTYRSFSKNNNYSWSLRILKENGKKWCKPIKLSEYRGSRFHGGYGDLVRLGDKKWMGICYSPGSVGFPRIEGILFSI